MIHLTSIHWRIIQSIHSSITYMPDMTIVILWPFSWVNQWQASTLKRSPTPLNRVTSAAINIMNIAVLTAYDDVPKRFTRGDQRATKELHTYRTILATRGKQWNTVHRPPARPVICNCVGGSPEWIRILLVTRLNTVHRNWSRSVVLWKFLLLRPNRISSATRSLCSQLTGNNFVLEQSYWLGLAT